MNSALTWLYSVVLRGRVLSWPAPVSWGGAAVSLPTKIPLRMVTPVSATTPVSAAMVAVWAFDWPGLEAALVYRAKTMLVALESFVR